MTLSLLPCAPRILVTCQKCRKSRDYPARIGHDEAIARFAKEHKCSEAVQGQ